MKDKIDVDEQVLGKARERTPSDYPTREEIRMMGIDELHDLYQRGAFPIMVSWLDLIMIRNDNDSR